jgi:hypothetical protein
MKCPFCASTDIRSYTDREHNLVWYLCWECRYQGYDARLFNEDFIKARQYAASLDDSETPD